LTIVDFDDKILTFLSALPLIYSNSLGDQKMHTVSLPECRRFLHALSQVAEDETTYIQRKIDDNRLLFLTAPKKDHSFKTRNIYLTAYRSLALLSTGPSIPLSDRVALLSSMETSLQKYASRVQKAVTRKWWYLIVRFFFNYSAKKPAVIVSLLQIIKEEVVTTKKRLEVQSRIEKPLKQFESAITEIQSFSDPKEINDLLDRLSFTCSKVKESARNACDTKRLQENDYQETLTKTDAIFTSVKSAAEICLPQLPLKHCDALLQQISTAIKETSSCTSVNDLENLVEKTSQKIERIGNIFWHYQSHGSLSRPEYLALTLRLCVCKKEFEKSSLARFSQLGIDEATVSEKKIERTKEKLNKIQSTFRDLLTKAQDANGSDALDSVYKNIDQELKTIIETEIKNDRFYYPSERLATTPKARILSKKLHELHTLTNRISNDLSTHYHRLKNFHTKPPMFSFFDSGFTPSYPTGFESFFSSAFESFTDFFSQNFSSSFTPNPTSPSSFVPRPKPKKTCLGLGKEIRSEITNIPTIQQKAKGNIALQSLCKRVLDASQKNNIAVIFDVEKLPESKQEFDTIVKKMSVLTHPDKNPNHPFASNFLQKIVNIAAARVRRKKYQS
jgi:hypothetical protein